MRDKFGLFSAIILISMMIFIVGCDKDNLSDIPIVSNTPKTTTPSTPIQPTPICGDNNLDSGEQCDGAVPSTATCENKGFDKGDVYCKKDCTLDYIACVNIVPCTDTDSGVDYTTKGTVTIISNGVTTTSTDYCRHGAFEDYVMEFSCEDAGMIQKSYKCVKGCNGNGACW